MPYTFLWSQSSVFHLQKYWFSYPQLRHFCVSILGLPLSPGPNSKSSNLIKNMAYAVKGAQSVYSSHMGSLVEKYS